MTIEECEGSAPSLCAVSTSTKETASSSSTAATTDEETQIIIKQSYEKKSFPSYSGFVVKHSFILFGLIFLFVVLCACLSLIPQLGAPPLPDFAEPIKGFEARGTVISNRWLSQFNLIENERKQDISRIPWQCRHNITLDSTTQPATAARAICNKYMTFYQGKLSMKLVFSTVHNHQNLLTAWNLKSICRLEKKVVRSFKKFEDHCHKDKKTQSCCPSWSVGDFIALLTGKPSCLKINQKDVAAVTRLLSKCSPTYQSGNLRPDCWDFKRNKKAIGKCRNVPEKCTRLNAVYNILHYLTDKGFLSDRSSDAFLRYTQVLVPVNADEDFQVDIYNSRLSKDFTDGNVVLTGFELSELKFAMFNNRLLKDLYLAAIAMFFIVTILWFYTRSFLITSMVGLIVVSSLIIAYFIYTIVFGMKFFPFLNILTFVFLVGIGADDAFVYMDVWNQAVVENKKRRVGPTTHEQRTHELISITAETMKHASMSMFVTSFTTSSAFFASLTSEITSIRLFGLYSGIAILCMLFLMVTWFPAAVIIDETVLSRCFSCTSFCTKLKSGVFRQSTNNKGVIMHIISWHRKFFNDFLPRFIIKFRYLWVVLFLGLAAGGILVATVKPGLKLPSSQDFQMFHESHELEKYSLKLKHNFYFETSDSYRFPIRLIWGIKPADNGDQFDPYNTGTLSWDSDFDVATPQGQVWMVKLIDRLKKQPFFAKDQHELSEKCFIEEFFQRMQINCSDHNRPCCRDSQFPYSSAVFSQCLLRMQCQKIQELQDTGHSITDGAPLFDVNGTLRVISLNFQSSIPFTWSYDPAENFWKQTDGWANREFVNAPSSANGWFISDLRFYDLQRSLSKGTFFSMGISLAIAFGVMLLTTGNIFISLFAIFTIIGALGVTIGSLVLLGWKLNILESVTMSVAVGLSVDFALHYGVAYVLAEDKTNRKCRVLFSVSRMGSAITMAAFTTFLTGAIVMPSNVLSYIQLGQFLMLIMSISWLYATFFFQALCSIFGPENDSGQLTMAKIKAMFASLKNCCTRNESDHYQVLRKKDGTVIKRQARVIYLNIAEDQTRSQYLDCHFDF